MTATGRKRLSMLCDRGHVAILCWALMASVSYSPESRRRASSRLGTRMTAMWLSPDVREESMGNSTRCKPDLGSRQAKGRNRSSAVPTPARQSFPKNSSVGPLQYGRRPHAPQIHAQVEALFLKARAQCWRGPLNHRVRHRPGRRQCAPYDKVETTYRGLCKQLQRLQAAA